MKRIICLSLFLLLLTLSAAAEEVRLQSVVPGETGTIALAFTLGEPIPAVMGPSSGTAPESEASAVPEPSTLELLGLGVLGLIAARMRRKSQ